MLSIMLHPVSKSIYFEELKEMVFSDNWPKAVPEYMLTDERDYQECLSRGCDILQFLIKEEVKGKRFLHYDLRDGSVVQVARDMKSDAFGYCDSFDVIWNNEFVLNDYDELVKQSPFDVIFLWDVLDHVVEEKSNEIIKSCYNLLSRGGTIYCRLHPWCGRHGADVYRQLNKSFIHLLFSEREFESLEIAIPFNKKVLQPDVIYRKWFEEYFDITKEEIDRWPIEPFFENGLLFHRFLRNFDLDRKNKASLPLKYLEQDFVDLTMVKK